MGNDILSTFLERKRNLVIEVTQIFMQYFVSEKVKLNRTIHKFVTIYFRDFWDQEEIDEEKLNQYFSLANIKDNDLKKGLLSVISFYYENGMEDKIEQDIKTVVLLANAFYLAFLFSKEIDKSYEEEDDFLPTFWRRHQSKLRLCKEERRDSLNKILKDLSKREKATYRKTMKCLENMQYGICKDPLLDFANGYFVTGNYQIKKLSRYSSKEVEQVYTHKNFYLNHAIITLEQISVEVVKEIMKSAEKSYYFIEVPIELCEKEEYYEAVKKVFTSPLLKKRVIFTFSYPTLIKHQKVASKLTVDGLQIAIKDLLEEEILENILKNVSYVFTSREFLLNHNRYHALFEDKNIRFILYEGGNL